MSTKLRIVVGGMIAATPFHGGATWAVLQYILGLRRLGHEVLFVESLKSAAIQPARRPLDSSHNATYFRAVMAAFDLDDDSALIDAETLQTIGLPHEQLEAFVRGADVLINIAGSLADEVDTSRIPIRLYLDLDPAFTQIWHAEYGVEMGFDRHTHFATIGQTIGQSGGPIPDCGRTWVPIWQPIVLSHWPVARDITYDAYTTIANWRSYGSIEREGIFYGQKAHSLREFFRLPAQIDATFTLALAIHPDETTDLSALRDNGWSLLHPADVTATPAAYQSFIQGSKAEFGIAKAGYVTARCGWFSDRSVCYLASGRPVIAQETRFSDFLPTGNGLFAFESIDDVADAIEQVNRDYAHHQRAAREIATEFFDSDRVLSALLSRIGAT